MALLINQMYARWSCSALLVSNACSGAELGVVNMEKSPLGMVDGACGLLPREVVRRMMRVGRPLRYPWA